MALAFIVSAILYERVQIAIQGDLTQRRLFRRLTGRIDRNWSELSKIEVGELGLESSMTADDLDLIGDRSLLSWCSLAGTKAGKRVLVEQLTTYAEAATVIQRQEAARELSPQVEIRHRLMLQLWQLGSASESLDGFSDWATQPTQSRPWVNWLSWIGPVCLMLGVAIAAICFEPIPGACFWCGAALAAIGLLTNMVLMLGYIGVIHNAFKQIESHHGLEATCQELLKSLSQMQSQSWLLLDIQRVLCDPKGNDSALAALPKLRWPMRLAGLRLNPTLTIPFLILQLVWLWDFRVYGWIERWRNRNSASVPQWLNCIGQLEAVLSSAAISHEYPNWTFPVSTLPKGVLFQANQIGHPLIPDAMRVCNDLQMDRGLPLLVVTGSNMSGKSTLMRSIGVNVALSRIGSPVCAESFSCPAMELSTSIRVRDSLADGVSFFMAELKRLRQVVDAVQHSRQALHRPSLVILDEILQGTNSRERQIAVSHVVQRLLLFDCLLLVSTHDLQLADADSFTGNCQVVHFREHFEEVDGQSQMKFDYRMHPGPAPTTNALKLLELVGLR